VSPNNPKILVTGGFGFLGGRIAQHLSTKGGYEIVLGSRCQAKPPVWLHQAKVSQVQWESTNALKFVCTGVDTVIHAAGMNAQDCARDPVLALKVNGLATANLLQAAIEQSVKRFIYISTAHVYGSPLIGEITEETCPRNLHPYATSHKVGEDVVRYANKLRQIEGIVVRLSNAFGAPAHKDVNCWTLLVNDLCRQAVEKNKLQLQSNGLQRRDFISIGEVCRAIEHIISFDSNRNIPEIINVGTGVSESVLGMARSVQHRCEQLFDFKPPLYRSKGGENINGEPLEYRIDNLKSTGFSPIFDKSTEIDKLLLFCRSAFTS
jgi:UDP-glucose 4-epimerase